MNRRDTLKAAVGGLLGMLGLGTVTWRPAQVGAMVTCYQVGTVRWIEGYKRCVVQMRMLKVRLGNMSKAIGAPNDRTLFGCKPGTLMVEQADFTPRLRDWWDVTLTCRVADTEHPDCSPWRRVDIIGLLTGRDC